jgi:hypothetical protein
MFSRNLFPARLVFTTAPAFMMLACTASTLHAEVGGSLFDRMRDDMTEFFDTVLPGTLHKYNLVLDFSPKFSDLRSREFIRYPLELRYGASDRLELFCGMTPFSPNPFNDGFEHRWGLGEITLGFRRNLEHGLAFYDQATVGLETRTPVGKPPLDLNSGYIHVKPFLTASCPLPWPHTKLFTSFSYDRELNTPGRDSPPPQIVRQNIAEVAPGFLYKPGIYGGFVEYQFRHLEEIDGHRLSNGGTVGMIWDVPRTRSKSWKLPGKWQIELGYKIVKEEGHGIDHGIVTRVRVRTTLREVLDSDLRHRLGL